MAEGGCYMKESEEINSLVSEEDLTEQEIDKNMEAAAGTENQLSPDEHGVDQFLHKIKCDRMYELRQIQHGTKPVTSTDHRGNIDSFFSKRFELQDYLSTQGKENVPANVDNVEEHRPDTVVVEIQGLSDQRRVSNVLGTNFRRRLENIIRGSISTVTRNHSPRPTPSPRRIASPSPASTSPVSTPREELTPPRAPLPESPLVTADRSRSNSILSADSSSMSNSGPSQNSVVDDHVPVDPEVRAPIPQVFEQLRGYEVGELQRENIVQEISELVHRRLVSATLEGSEFRSRMEILMQDRLAQSGTDGQRVQEFVQNIQPSRPIIRNDFSNLGINNMAGGDNWDNISITSVSATAVPYTQSNLYMSRELQSLKAQLAEMKNMMKLSFDLQMDIQRSIRQEVAAAMNQGASGTMTAPAAIHSKPVNETHCLICLDDYSDSVLYQCGHMCVCFKCGKDLVSRGSKCPVCRAPIKDIIRAFKCNQD